jgi:hypothetical protein
VWGCGVTAVRFVVGEWVVGGGVAGLVLGWLVVRVVGLVLVVTSSQFGVGLRVEILLS